MIIPKNLEELASYVESDQKVVFFFTANWCPDCHLSGLELLERKMGFYLDSVGGCRCLICGPAWNCESICEKRRIRKITGGA